MVTSFLSLLLSAVSAASRPPLSRPSSAQSKLGPSTVHLAPLSLSTSTPIFVPLSLSQSSSLDIRHITSPLLQLQLHLNVLFQFHLIFQPGSLGLHNSKSLFHFSLPLSPYFCGSELSFILSHNIPVSFHSRQPLSLSEPGGNV